MRALLRLAGHRLASRPDSEHRQIVARALTSAALALFLPLIDDSARVWLVSTISLLTALVLSPLLLLHLLWHPGISHWRRALAVAADSFILPICIVLGGETTLPFLTFIIWTSIAHGLRFGRRYLYASSIIAAISFIATAALDPAWNRSMGFEASMTFGLLALPLYFGAVLRQKEEAHAELHSVARRDALTGLPNRLALIETFQQPPPADRGVALLAIDLDGFKAVNDGLGHAAGDLLLQATAGRIIGCLENSDRAFRLAGDEFVVHHTGNTASIQSSARSLAERIIGSLGAPFDLRGKTGSISASIGIAASSLGGEVDERLLDEADQALYHAKDEGKSRACTFTGELRRSSQRRTAIERRLRLVGQHDGVELFFQPQVDARTFAPVAVEALARWHDAEIGNVRPNELVAAAERVGIVQELGRRLLMRACSSAASWRGNAGHLRLAVNVSVAELLQPGYVGEVADILARTSLEPARLELELTESRAAQEAVAERMRELETLGVTLAIDDFGAGATSLAYFRSLPFHTLKLDKRFIDDLLLDEAARAVVFAVIELARSLDKKIVAEGIEQIEQANLLATTRCDLLQGYLFAKPMPESALLDFARAWDGSPAADGEQRTPVSACERRA